MAKKKKSIEKWQITKIKTLQSKLGMSSEDYYNVLHSNYQVNSCTKLSYSQANDLIAAWEKLAKEQGAWQAKEKPASKFAHLSNRGADYATIKQLELIDSLWQKVSFTEAGEARDLALNKFIHRITGIAHIEWLKKSQVQKVIAAIEEMPQTKGGE